MALMQFTTLNLQTLLLSAIGKTQYMCFPTSSWSVLIKYIFQHGWLSVRGVRAVKSTPDSRHTQLSHLSHIPRLQMSPLPASLPYSVSWSSHLAYGTYADGLRSVWKSMIVSSLPAEFESLLYCIHAWPVIRHTREVTVFLTIHWFRGETESLLNNICLLSIIL